MSLSISSRAVNPENQSSGSAAASSLKTERRLLIRQAHVGQGGGQVPKGWGWEIRVRLTYEHQNHATGARCSYARNSRGQR